MGSVVQVLMMFNPAAGSANAPLLHAIRDELTAQGATVTLYPTQRANDALEYLSAYQGELDVVAACGGDGTVNEVINGLKQRDNASWRLAIIPLGTTNVLARELGIKKHARFLSAMIAGGKEKPIYPGRFNDRRFLLMTGVGYDAWVVQNVDLALKKKMGKVAYVLSMLKQLRHFGKKQYRVQVDGVEYVSNSVIITNGRFYGGSFIISRQADLSAPTTQVLMLNGRSPLALLLSLLGLPLGLMEKMPGIISIAASHVQIECISHASETEPVQVDGDYAGRLPLTIEMEKTPLRVLIP